MKRKLIFLGRTLLIRRDNIRENLLGNIITFAKRTLSLINVNASVGTEAVLVKKKDGEF
jgi:hypothetical protein